MNVQITKNNLLLIVKELETNKKPSEKSKAYLQFIKDGVMTIDILNNMIDDLNNTIAVNFRSEVVKKIDEKQAFRKLRTLEDENKELKAEINQLKETNDKLINQITV